MQRFVELFRDFVGIGDKSVHVPDVRSKHPSNSKRIGSAPDSTEQALRLAPSLSKALDGPEEKEMPYWLSQGTHRNSDGARH